MIKEKVRQQLDRIELLDDRVEKANKWRNLQFYKNGVTAFGLFIHDTEEEAIRANVRLKERIARKEISFVDSDKGLFPIDIYLHSIPMPVND